MKIAFFGNYYTFFPFRAGGIESWVRRLGRYLLDQGHEVDFILYHAPQKGPGENPGENFNIFFDRDPQVAIQRIASGAYDVIQLQKFPSRGFRTFLKKKKTGSTLVRTHFFYKEFTPGKKLVTRFYQRFFNETIAISPRIKNLMENNNFQCSLLLPPVPDHFFINPEEKNTPKPIISYIGRIAPEKGVWEIIEVFKTLRQKMGDGVLPRIIGYSIPEREDSLNLHEFLQNQKDIEYIHSPIEENSAPENTIAKLLKESDIVILPYRSLEKTLDLPFLFLEAIATLNIVVTTDVGDLSELSPNPQLILPIGAKPSEMLKVIENNALNNLEGEKAKVLKKREEIEISLSQVGRKYLDLIKK